MRSPLMILLLSAISFAAVDTTSAPTLEEAQKAYVSGNWTVAAKNFEAVCPTLDQAKHSECALWGVLARSQTGNSKDFSQAKKRLDSLVFATPDSLPVFSDLYMTKAQFELYLKRPDLSYKSLKTAFAKAQPNQVAVLYQVCQSLYKASPIDSVQSLCSRIETAKSNPSSNSAIPGSSSSADSNPAPLSSSSSLSAEPPLSSSAATVAPTADDGAWTIQLGAFGLQANAEMLVNSLKTKKIEARIVEASHDDRTLYLVQTGAFGSREEAVEFANKALIPHKLEFQPVKKP